MSEQIKPWQSSQINASFALVVAGLYSLWKIVGVIRIKLPWGAIEPTDFINVALALQVLGTGLFILWKRYFRPFSRPVAPGPVAQAVGRVTGGITP
jgi:hypothetical protein